MMTLLTVALALTVTYITILVVITIAHELLSLDKIPK